MSEVGLPVGDPVSTGTGASDPFPLLGELLEVKGPLHLPLHFELSGDLLVLVPARLDARLVVRSVRVPLDRIDWVKELPAGDVLLVVEGARHLLRGEGARKLCERVRDLRPETATMADAIILEAEGAVEVNGILSARGTVRVTLDRLFFHPERLERRVFGDRQVLDLALEEIEGLRLQPGCRLELRAAERVVRFLGPSVPSLYAALTSARERSAERRQTEELIKTVTFPAVDVGAPVHVAGAVVLAGEQLSFIPTGMLEALVGMGGVTCIPLHELLSLKVGGVLHRHLTIASATAQLSLACEDPTFWLREIVRRTALATDAPSWNGGVAGRVAVRPSPLRGELSDKVQEILAAQASRVLVPGEILTFCFAVQLDDQQALTGWLALTSTTLFWIPRDEQQEPVRIPFDGRTVVLKDYVEDHLVVRVGANMDMCWVVADPGILRVLKEWLEGPKGAPLAAQAARPPRREGGDGRLTFRAVAVEGCDVGFAMFRQVAGVLVAVDARLANLSLHGVGVVCKERLEVGAPLVVLFHFKGVTRELTATVVHGRELERGEGHFAGCVFQGSWGNVEAVTRGPWLALMQARTKLTPAHVEGG